MNGPETGTSADLERLFDEAVRDTLARFEATGSPVITDGEQRKPSFATYPIHGNPALRPGGVTIPFADGHTRQLPSLAAGPFRYRTYAGSYVAAAKKHTSRPMKQAVISASILRILGERARQGRTIFVGVTDPIDPRIETKEVVRDRILAAAKYIDPALLGSTDDCGFSPFGDDASTSRDTAFAKIQARVEGNALASAALSR